MSSRSASPWASSSRWASSRGSSRSGWRSRRARPVPCARAPHAPNVARDAVGRLRAAPGSRAADGAHAGTARSSRDFDLALVVDGATQPAGHSTATSFATTPDGMSAPPCPSHRRRDGSTPRSPSTPIRRGTRSLVDLNSRRRPGARRTHRRPSRRALERGPGRSSSPASGRSPTGHASTAARWWSTREPHPIGMCRPPGHSSSRRWPRRRRPPGEPIRVAATSPSGTPGGEAARRPARRRSAFQHEPLANARRARRRGDGPGARPRHGDRRARVVFGRDAQGNPQVRAHAGEGGAFASTCRPPSSSGTRRSTRAARAALVSFVPGTPRDLVLDVSPGGDLHVNIVGRRRRQAAHGAPPRPRRSTARSTRASAPTTAPRAQARSSTPCAAT